MLTLKYTLGIRLSLEEELRGSDEVEHNIKEVAKPLQRNHSLGKRVEHRGRESPVQIEMVVGNKTVA